MCGPFESICGAGLMFGAWDYFVSGGNPDRPTAADLQKAARFHEAHYRKVGVDFVFATWRVLASQPANLRSDARFQALLSHKIENVRWLCSVKGQPGQVLSVCDDADQAAQSGYLAKYPSQAADLSGWRLFAGVAPQWAIAAVTNGDRIKAPADKYEVELERAAGKPDAVQPKASAFVLQIHEVIQARD